MAQHISEQELKPLEFLEGEWNVSVDIRLSKNGPWEKSAAGSVIRRVVGKTIFEEEYSGSKQGLVLTAKAGSAATIEQNAIKGCS
jgi:hypothetical protein